MSHMLTLEIVTEGLVKSSNLEAFRSAFLDWLARIPTALVNDADFARAEDDIKELSGSEKSLDAALAAIIGGMSDVSAISEAVAKLRGEATKTRLALTKLVESKKEERKAALVSEAMATLPGAGQSARQRLEQAGKGKRTLMTFRTALQVEGDLIAADADEVVSYVRAAGGEPSDEARLKWGGLAAAQADMQRAAAQKARGAAEAELKAAREQTRLAEEKARREALAAKVAADRAERDRAAEAEQARAGKTIALDAREQNAREQAIASEIARQRSAAVPQIGVADHAADSGKTISTPISPAQEETQAEEMARYKSAVRQALGGLKPLRDALQWRDNIEAARGFASTITFAFKAL